MQGPLQKQGGQFSKQWRGRYFALERGHELRWWQNERLFLEGARARGEVDLRGARVELLSTDGGNTGPGHRKNTSLQSPLASFQAPPKQRVSRKLSARWSSVSTVPPNVLQLIPAQGAYSRDLLLQASTKAELQIWAEALRAASGELPLAGPVSRSTPLASHGGSSSSSSSSSSSNSAGSSGDSGSTTSSISAAGSSSVTRGTAAPPSSTAPGNLDPSARGARKQHVDSAAAVIAAADAWRVCTDAESGLAYYAHSHTGATEWEKPREVYLGELARGGKPRGAGLPKQGRQSLPAQRHQWSPPQREHHQQPPPKPAPYRHPYQRASERPPPQLERFMGSDELEPSTGTAAAALHHEDLLLLPGEMAPDRARTLTWEEHFDPYYKTVFYVNQSTGAKSWTRPTSEPLGVTARGRVRSHSDGDLSVLQHRKARTGTQAVQGSCTCNWSAGLCTDGTPATHECSECKEMLCAECFAAHSLGRGTRGHTISPLISLRACDWSAGMCADGTAAKYECHAAHSLGRPKATSRRATDFGSADPTITSISTGAMQLEWAEAGLRMGRKADVQRQQKQADVLAKRRQTHGPLST